MILTNKSASFLTLLRILQCLRIIRSVAAADTAASFFNDPDVVQDWIFQMINIYPVWERGIFGKGIRIRVNDEGVDYRHEEFQGRFDTDSSCESFDVWFDESSQTYLSHGTAVASVIGAAGNNDQCAVGIAPEVTLSSCAVVGVPLAVMDKTTYDQSYPAYKLDTMDISHNSFGFVPCRRIEAGYTAITFPNTNTCPFTHRPDNIFSYNGTRLDNMQHPCDVCDFPSSRSDATCSVAVDLHCLFYLELDQDACKPLLNQRIVGGECSFQSLKTIRASIEKGATQGRNGKGIIYVYASGNDFFSGDNTNFENLGRYVILVGAVGKDGQHSSYSTAGSNVLLTAPAGDYDEVDRQTVARAGGGCMLSDDGTSFSSPIVSGIIALMLQVNPNLTWRDVQGILVTTSEPITHTLYDDRTQTVNGAGLVHSNLYGFGMVNAMAAVTAAENWKNYGPEQVVIAKAMDLDLTIPDSSPIFSQLEVTNAPIFVENIEVKLYIQHLTRGHLKISLTSPDGTVSELVPGSIPENGNNQEAWILRTVKSWGEVPEGTWTLSIVDEVDGDLSNCVDKPIQITDGFTFGCNVWELVPLYHNERFMTDANYFWDEGVATGCCICSGGFFCEDSLDPNICLEAFQYGYCGGGEMMAELAAMAYQDENGLTMREACCLFGGGTVYEDTSKFVDKLLGWELKIFGHADPSKTASPTMRPTFSPTAAPASGAFTLKTWVLITLGFIVSLFTI